MYRFLYVADSADRILDSAQVPSRYAAGRGWRVDAMAPGASCSQACAATFRATFEPFWTANRLDLRNFGRASRRFREFVERGGYDVVHVVSPASSLLTSYALRPLNGLGFPRLLVSPGRSPGFLARFAPHPSDGSEPIATDWGSVYEQLLGLDRDVAGSRPTARASAGRTRPAYV